ncbi:MAG TPA: ABC transporter permease, partial [Chthoniobacterales bacterium]
MNWSSFEAIGSVARKEFIHIYRDRRVLLLLLILPPVFTLIFGHAFESGERKDVPALLINADQTERTQRFVDLILANETFAWRQQTPDAGGEADLLAKGVRGTLIIPQGWSASLENGEPIPLQMYLDGSDTSTAEQLNGSLQKSLGDFQMNERTEMIDRLPDEVIQFGKQLPL